MKISSNILKHLLTTILLFGSEVNARAQVTVTSSDSLSCTVHCTTLTAHITGDTAINAGITMDDIYSVAHPIGFSFNFYGAAYTSLVIGANGTVSFNASDAGGGDPWPITAALLGNPSKLNNICGPWCDIDIFYTGTPIGTETYSTIGVAPNRKFIVAWCGCSMFQCSNQLTTSQIILYEGTNVIEVHLAHKDICTSWNPMGGTNGGRAIIGVQNASGTAATVAPGRDWVPVWSASDEAWRFTPDATGASYSVASIAYNPEILTTATIYWYNMTTGGTYMGTGPTETVCPGVQTLYRACALVCADTVSGYYMVTPIPTVTPTYTSTNPTMCGACDGTITISGLVPGAPYSITYTLGGVPQTPITGTASATGTVIITGLCAGTYDNILPTQPGVCMNAVGPAVLVDPPISISSVDVLNPSVCGACDGSLTLKGLYPSHVFTINYTLNGVAQTPLSAVSSPSGTITLTGLCDGAVYNNIVASFSTCVTPPMGPYTMTAPPPPSANIVSVVSPSECGKCNGSITIRSVIPWSSDTIGYTYGTTIMPTFPTVANGDSSVYLPGLCAGTYSNMSIKIGNCLVQVNGTAILTDPLLTAGFTDVTHLGCNGDSIFFKNNSTTSPTGSLYYLWSFGDGSSDSVANPVHVYPAGTYTVHLTATNHYCSSYDSTNFTLGHPLQAIFTETPDILCQGQTAVTTNTSIGAAGYMWYFSNAATDTNTNATYTYQRAGTYNLTLIARNAIPCYDTMHKTIYVDTISGIKINLTDSVLCAGTYITATGLYASLGNTGVTWAFGDGDSVLNKNPIYHAFNNLGTYTITATAHYRACQDTSTTRVVNVFQQPTINIGRDTSICKGSESITLGDNLNTSNTGANYVWSTGEKTRMITVVAPGTYFATVNINNCYASDTILVSNDCYMDIPNAFTPNGDGINDYFFPRQMLTKGLTAFSMNIYNRWGQLIFETTTLDGSGWDGKLNNVDQPSGVYIYIIDATFKDGQKEHHQGNITLLR